MAQVSTLMLCLCWSILAVCLAGTTVNSDLEKTLMAADNDGVDASAPINAMDADVTDSIDFHRRRRQVGTNIDAALRNPSFVRFQLSCLLDRGSCDRIGQRIKSLLPEMVSTGQCGQCTAHEVGQAGKVIIFIQEHYPMEYDLLEKKYVQDAEAQEVHDQERIGM